MRKAGINVIHKVSNGILAPIGGGITSAGTPIKVTMQANNLYRLARKVKNDMNENIEEIKSKISEKCGFLPQDLDFHLELDTEGFLIVETNSKTSFRCKIQGC